MKSKSKSARKTSKQKTKRLKNFLRSPSGSQEPVEDSSRMKQPFNLFSTTREPDDLFFYWTFTEVCKYGDIYFPFFYHLYLHNKKWFFFPNIFVKSKICKKCVKWMFLKMFCFVAKTSLILLSTSDRVFIFLNL